MPPQLHRAIPILLAAMIAGCSEDPAVIEVVFPSKTLADVTSLVEVEVWRQTSTVDQCYELNRESPPGEEQDRVYHAAAPFPFTAGDLEIDDLPQANYAFVAVAWNQADRRARFLRGCTTQPGYSGERVQIMLDEFRGCCMSQEPGCSGNTSVSCYDGPDSTRGTGPCKGGTATCTGGYFTTCASQVLPVPETCNGEDDDCDGATDEGGVCSSGADAAPLDAGADH